MLRLVYPCLVVRNQVNLRLQYRLPNLRVFT
jgi:hypothetical protein